MASATGKLWSKMKPAEKFELTWLEHGYGGPEDYQKDYRFLADRGYELDFAWPKCHVGVEIHGFGFGHQAQQRVARDCEKIREAILVGWLIIPFTTRCISSKDNCLRGVEMVCDVLARRYGKEEYHVDLG
jgi:hypothetical protein